ncbi:MAG: hypothetical protein MO852_12255 [Candidatus Devosia euplotis]|nr:hypothetical protein [Candidatus Devosia euplotis]
MTPTPLLNYSEDKKPWHDSGEIIEHDMAVVFSLADKISVLAQGRIIADGAPDQVRGNPKVQEASHVGEVA